MVSNLFSFGFTTLNRGHSLFQALGQWGLSNAAGRRATCDEWGLAEKAGRLGRSPSHALLFFSPDPARPAPAFFD